MGLTYQVYLTGDKIYTCTECSTHLARVNDLISKNFQSHSGKAYLFGQAVNITTGPSEDRLLRTGLHTVADIFCERCSTNVGWTYLHAYEDDQKYKENKFVLEKARMSKLLHEYDSTFLKLVDEVTPKVPEGRRSSALAPVVVAMHPRGFHLAEARREMGQLLA